MEKTIRLFKQRFLLQPKVIYYDDDMSYFSKRRNHPVAIKKDFIYLLMLFNW